MIIPSKSVTEDDVKATEARLGESFAGLKRAVMNIPSEATKPVTDVVKKHPYASVTVAAGAGFLAYRLLNLLIPRTKVINREINVQPELEIKEHKKSSALSNLFSQAMTMATPYVIGYVQNEAARLFSGHKQGPPAEGTVEPSDTI